MVSNLQNQIKKVEILVLMHVKEALVRMQVVLQQILDSFTKNPDNQEEPTLLMETQEIMAHLNNIFLAQAQTTIIWVNSQVEQIIHQVIEPINNHL